MAVFKAREHVATVDSFPECDQGSAIDEIACVFRCYELWQFSSTDPSVQLALLNLSPKVKRLYKAVRLAARFLLFDLVFELVCGPGVTIQEDTLESAKARTRLIVDPDTLEYDERVRQYVIEKYRGEGKKFLKTLGDDHYNAGRRAARLPVDVLTLILARHWVNPHCPLWMMTTPMLKKVLPRLAVDVSCTVEAIRNRIDILSDAGALRFPGLPIFELDLLPIPRLRPDADNSIILEPGASAGFSTVSEALAIPDAIHSSKGTPKEPYYHPTSGMVIQRFSVLGEDPINPLPDVAYTIKYATQRRRSV